MTTQDFAYWLNGFIELHGEKPNDIQWESIKEHLGLVFNKETKLNPGSKSFLGSVPLTTTDPKLNFSLRDLNPTEETFEYILPFTGDNKWRFDPRNWKPIQSVTFQPYPQYIPELTGSANKFILVNNGDTPSGIAHGYLVKNLGEIYILPNSYVEREKPQNYYSHYTSITC